MKTPLMTFSIDIPLKLEDQKWILGLTRLEVYNCLFKVTEKNIKIKTYFREEEDPNNRGENLMKK